VELDEADQRLEQAIHDFLELATTSPPETRGWFLTQVTSLWTARADLAMRTWKHQLCRERLEAAATLAQDPLIAPETREALELKLLQFSLATDTTGETLRRLHADRGRFTGSARSPSLAIDARSLIAHTWVEHGETAQAVKLLREASQKAEAVPHKRWGVLISLAAAEESHDELAALDTYEQALSVARKIGAVPQAAQSTLAKLAVFGLKARHPSVRAAADRALAELRRLRATNHLALILPQRALQLTVEDDAAARDAALRDLDEAERYATSDDQRWLVLLGRVLLARHAGRTRDTLDTVVRAIDELSRFARDAGGQVTERSSWLGIFGTLHRQAASLAVDLGLTEEALEWAEAGRAVQLRGQLAKTAGSSAGIEAFAELRPWLEQRGNALAYLCVTGSRTLLIGQTASGELFGEFIDIEESEVDGLLPARSFSDDWTSRVFAAARRLQERLAPPLMRLSAGCRTLYIVPDSRLCFLPFAALEAPTGGALLDQCAVALAPSIAILRRCLARAPVQPPSSCLTVGFGHAKARVPRPADDFALQARAVAGLGWSSVDELLDRDATASRVLEALDTTHDVVHIAAHGKIDGGGQLSSSRISLADGELSARTIAELDGRLHAGVVFLNACLSGRFESALPGEFGGFWEAFLRAGAATLVAPLTHVDPYAASELALDFHTQRLAAKATKAEALRHAQLSVRARHPSPEAWASHVLVGDAE
jgi:tetratricopeptide (TPR) repeat protein